MMKNSKKSLVRVAAAAVAALALAAGLAACAPQAPAGKTDSSGEPGTAQEQVDVAAEEGMYQSDEQCLSCHGGSYEALASTTASYGLSNPHNSIHGGYNSCVNCHARDKEITDNKCDNCHTWPHNPETGPGANLQNAPQ